MVQGLIVTAQQRLSREPRPSRGHVRVCQVQVRRAHLEHVRAKLAACNTPHLGAARTTGLQPDAQPGAQRGGGGQQAQHRDGMRRDGQQIRMQYDQRVRQVRRVDAPAATLYEALNPSASSSLSVSAAWQRLRRPALAIFRQLRLQ